MREKTTSEEKRTDRLQARVTPTIRRLAEAQAAKEGRTVSNYIERLILKDCEKE